MQNECHRRSDGESEAITSARAEKFEVALLQTMPARTLSLTMKNVPKAEVPSILKARA
jgi:hypothetical protein